MTLVVFGRTGQVARELAVRRPDAVYLDRAAVDLSDPSSVAPALAPHLADADAVINAAAWTAVDKAEEAEDAARAINGESPGAMARACAAAGVPFVHVSTDYVFDGRGTDPRRPADPTAPLGAYGRTKLAGEEAVRAAGGTYAILRTSWVFSAYGSNFVTTMLRLSQTRDALTIVADQVGGPTPAAAIAEACLRIAGALRDDPGLGGTYHFTGAPDVSWADFARAIFDAAGRSVAVTDIASAAYPTPAARPLNSRLDCAATRAAFGIERPDWRAHLRAILPDLLHRPGAAT